MIVRILEDGQYEIADSEVADLDALDAALEQAVASGDKARYETALDALLSRIRAVGRRIEDTRIVTSGLAVPSEHMSIEEVAALLASEEGAN